MFIKSYKKTQCIKGCTLFNDNSNYNYWESRQETSDEIKIVQYINQKIDSRKIKILHIGIGNSYVALNVEKYDCIDAISISGNEILNAQKLNINKYKTFFLNKLANNAFDENEIASNYDIIIDANLKSFSCCDHAFEKLFKIYVSKLVKNGEIITGRKGMNWSRNVKPTYAFSLSKLLYKRLKEIDGPSSNILSINDCEKLANKFNLKLFYDHYVCSFKKL